MAERQLRVSALRVDDVTKRQTQMVDKRQSKHVPPRQRN
jgi:hypothetical protein